MAVVSVRNLPVRLEVTTIQAYKPTIKINPIINNFSGDRENNWLIDDRINLLRNFNLN